MQRRHTVAVVPRQPLGNGTPASTSRAAPDVPVGGGGAAVEVNRPKASDNRKRLIKTERLTQWIREHPPPQGRRRFWLFGKIIGKPPPHQPVADALAAYHRQVASLKIDRDLDMRQNQVQDLSATLDRVETRAMAYVKASRSAPHRAEMLKIVAEVDAERLLLVRVLNNPEVDGSRGLSWGQAAEFARHGVPVGANTRTDGIEDANLVGEPQILGRGRFNVVVKARYNTAAGIRERVIKTLTAEEEPGRRGIVAARTGIPAINPRYGARNVATSLYDQKLGLRVIPKSTFATHGGRLAVAMELASGVTAQKLAASQDSAHTLSNQKLQKAVNDLEWLDALTGQGDRHACNYHVEINPETGDVRLGGVDNDQSFGKSFTDPDATLGLAGRNVGLPTLISRDLADKVRETTFDRDLKPDLVELLDDAEIAAAKTRFDAVKGRINSLERQGLVVDDWATWKHPNMHRRGSWSISVRRRHAGTR